MIDPDRQCRCPRRTNARRSVWPVFAGIVIALIPKCPFCILAYSSAITLCSGAKLYQHSPVWTSYISIGLAAVTLVLILWNFKGTRTILAACCVCLGSFFIVVSEIYTGSPPHYYLGASVLMFGVWMNANFMYFYRRYFSKTLRSCGQLISPITNRFHNL